VRVLEFKGSGPRLYDGSRALTAANPEESATRRLGGISVRPQRLFFLFSPVFAYAIDRFLDSIDEDSRVLIVEAEEEAVYPDRKKWERVRSDPRCETLFGLSQKAAEAKVEAVIQGSRVRSIQPVWMTGAARRNKSYYEEILKRAEETLALTWQNRATTISFGRLWIRNLFLNLPETPQSVDALAPLADRPLLVLGAGPSLEGCTDFLRRRREELRVVAVDTALPYLLAIGILPDILVSMDAQQLNVKDLLPPPPEGIKLLYDATAAPSFVRKFPKEDRYAYLSHFAEGSIWELLREAGVAIPRIEAGGSVGTTALLLADRLRSYRPGEELPIFLAGLDFAFSPGLPHARMTYTHLLTLTTMRRLAPLPFLPAHLSRNRVQAPAKGGGETRTDYVLASYAAQLRSGARRFRNVYDLSREGVEVGMPILDQSTAEEMITGKVWKGSAESAAVVPADAKLEPQAVERFLRKEWQALHRLAQVIRGEGAGPKEAVSILSEHDYVSYYFPDPEPREDASYFRRVIASVSYLLRTLNKLL
jgi:hypothetical protein